jgi:hypothetical protein
LGVQRAYGKKLAYPDLNGSSTTQICLSCSLIPGASWFAPFAKYSQTDQVEEDEVGGACSTSGEEEESIYVIGGKVRGKETTRKTKTYVGG